jgi:pimeloyl-ACP methyl ester carboxylesterase
VKKTLLIVVALLILLVTVPPLWNAISPSTLPDLPAPGTKVAVRDGASVNVLEVGTGQPIVLVHGLPGTAYDWRNLTPKLAEAGFRVIAYDRLGYGHSDMRPGDLHTVKENGADLLALLHNLNLSDAIVVGWSYGGATVMQAATRDASRMALMVLVGTSGPASADDEPPRPSVAAKMFYSKPAMLWRMAVPSASRALMAVLSDAAFSEGPQPDWWLDGVQANFKRWETMQTYSAEIFAEIDPDAISFDTLSLPTLIIHAEDDRLATVEIARYLSGAICCR